MPSHQPPPWQPHGRLRVQESYDSSMGTTRVRIGKDVVYVKAMGNRQGPHALACEYVGTRLAEWYGLPVAEYAVYPLSAEDCFDLPRGARAAPGPAFVSRHVPGRTWGKATTDLPELVNAEDVTRLVVFDTWVRNCDRYPPDPATRKPNYNNVYLAETDHADRARLIAIDHTHCFDRTPDLSKRLADIDRVRDERTYGLFPAFVPRLDLGQMIWCGSMLRSLNPDDVRGMVQSLPNEWAVRERSPYAPDPRVLQRRAVRPRPRPRRGGERRRGAFSPGRKPDRGAGVADARPGPPVLYPGQDAVPPDRAGGRVAEAPAGGGPG